jgi:RNase P/RNase MRP subunit p29
MTTQLISTRLLATLVMTASLTACGGNSANNVGIGGTVSGLTTGTLVLSNGYSSLNLPAGTTAFGFNTRLPTGAVYNVTVQSAPPMLTCVVPNPTGVATSDITNIQVVCVPNNTLGGTVSGLRATGLALTNGSDVVNIPANATSFVFTRRVGQGAAYGVTILSQPAGQSCSLANAVGTMGTADVANIQVSCI